MNASVKTFVKVMGVGFSCVGAACFAFVGVREATEFNINLRSSAAILELFKVENPHQIQSYKRFANVLWSSLDYDKKNMMFPGRVFLRIMFPASESEMEMIRVECDEQNMSNLS